jgi:hypothetical protein
LLNAGALPADLARAAAGAAAAAVLFVAAKVDAAAAALGQAVPAPQPRAAAGAPVPRRAGRALRAADAPADLRLVGRAHTTAAHLGRVEDPAAATGTARQALTAALLAVRRAAAAARLDADLGRVGGTAAADAAAAGLIRMTAGDRGVVGAVAAGAVAAGGKLPIDQARELVGPALRAGRLRRHPVPTLPRRRQVWGAGIHTLRELAVLAVAAADPAAAGPPVWAGWQDTDGRADWLLLADLAFITAAATQAIGPATACFVFRTAATQARIVATDVGVRIHARDAVVAALEAWGAAVRLARAARVVQGAAGAAA